eukprot:gene11645-13531_t
MEKSMFLEISKEPRDIAMMKVESLGPKMECIDPPRHSPLLSNAWDPSHVTIQRMDLSAWEGSDKFCVVLHNILTPEECAHLIDLSERKGYGPALVNVGNNNQVRLEDTRNNERCMHDDPQLVEEIWQRVLFATAQQDSSVHHSIVHVPWINERNQRRNNGKIVQAVGLNERMRYLRYDPGTFFAPHYDGSYVRAKEAGVERSGEQSFVTFQLYLNEDFKGGSTRFMSQDAIYHGDDTQDSDEETADDTKSASWFSFRTPPRRKKARGDSIKVVPRTGSVLLFQHDCLHEGARVRTGRKYAVRTDVMYTARGPGLEYAKQPIIARQFDDLY